MGSYEEFYANIRCMFRLQNMYCCSCALHSSSNTTAFAFYIESPFFVEIIIIFTLFSQYRKVIGTESFTTTSTQLSWLTGRRADCNDGPLLIRATVTLPPQEVQVRLKVKWAVLSTRPFSIQVLQASILSNIVNDVNGCQGEAAGLMLSKLHRQHQIHPSVKKVNTLWQVFRLGPCRCRCQIQSYIHLSSRYITWYDKSRSFNPKHVTYYEKLSFCLIQAPFQNLFRPRTPCFHTLLALFFGQKILTQKMHEQKWWRVLAMWI